MNSVDVKYSTADKMKERSETRYLVSYDLEEAACGGKGGAEGKWYTIRLRRATARRGLWRVTDGKTQ
jgi:hypothetical protein